jgi:hypothetical protein
VKIIGIVFLSFSVFWYLFSKGREYDKMPNMLKTEIKTLTKISDLVRFRNMTKEEIMKEINFISFAETYSESFADFFTDFFADFGKSDTESELARIELYKKDLNDKLEDFSKECRDKSKLCKNMSFLASLFIIVVFI